MLLIYFCSFSTSEQTKAEKVNYEFCKWYGKIFGEESSGLVLVIYFYSTHFNKIMANGNFCTGLFRDKIKILLKVCKVTALCDVLQTFLRSLK